MITKRGTRYKIRIRKIGIHFGSKCTIDQLSYFASLLIFINFTQLNRVADEERERENGKSTAMLFYASFYCYFKRRQVCWHRLAKRWCRFPTRPGAPGARDLPARNISARTKSAHTEVLHDRFRVNYIEECAAGFVKRNESALALNYLGAKRPT